MSTNPSPFGTGGQQPYQFQPESYGARGNGQIATDVTSNTSTTFNSATVAADPSAVGKIVMINGANGNPGVPVLGTITGVNPGAGTFTVSQAAVASVSNCQAIWGTDDSAAINAAIAAAQTYALAGNYLAEVLFGSKIYMTGTLLQSSSPVVYNTQILVPWPNVNGLTRKLMITLRGAGNAGALQYWEATTPNVQGTAIVSTLTAPSTVDPTFGIQSVIGGPTGSGAFTGGFANTHLTVSDLSVWSPAYTNIKALFMDILSGCSLRRYASNIFAPANNLSGAPSAHPYLADLTTQALFQNSHGIGISFPANQNNDISEFDSITVEGYEIGCFGVDHIAGRRAAILYCDVIWKSTPSQSHEVSIQALSAEQYNGGYLVTGSGGAILKLDIGWDGEVTSPSYDVSDSSNIATGEFRWVDLFHATPVVTGAANLKVVNNRLGPGLWAGKPAVPASTVAQQNTSWRDATVQVTGGTVSQINVDGQNTGLTAGMFSVPAGKNITLTYTVAPTWNWWLQ